MFKFNRLELLRRRSHGRRSGWEAARVSTAPGLLPSNSLRSPSGNGLLSAPAAVRHCCLPTPAALVALTRAPSCFSGTLEVHTKMGESQSICSGDPHRGVHPAAAKSVAADDARSPSAHNARTHARTHTHSENALRLSSPARYHREVSPFVSRLAPSMLALRKHPHTCAHKNSRPGAGIHHGQARGRRAQVCGHLGQHGPRGTEVRRVDGPCLHEGRDPLRGVFSVKYLCAVRLWSPLR